MKCKTCNKGQASHSVIHNGDLYEDVCDTCLHQLLSSQSVSSGLASYNRQRDLEDHMHDMVQPYVGGKPNRDFIILYPDRSKQLFTAEQLRKYG